MYVMSAKDTSKGWCYYGEHIGMDAACSTVFSRFHNSRRKNIFLSDHRLDSAYYPSNNYGHYSAGDRRHAVSSQRQKSQRRRFLARCGSFDQNQNRLRMGFESCRADIAGSTSMGRRAAGLAYQYAGATQERKIAYRTGCRNARRSSHLVWKQENSCCGRRFLRVVDWVEHKKHVLKTKDTWDIEYWSFPALICHASK